ncbi:MAG: class I SAM-dependent methyltransferase [Candidatus Microthrix subdominans]|jgi:ubiquinone/menaquinone biosynthesis C-methylase UbiE|uniref:Class I SAM-dependent methyltransferase n=1 Tax=Candidatus Neomicrothrix subdominans TaxID=2954438 RepID=A0A936TFQ6_9ACTN|nr:class I SAM-dependent methyltransferase [Candidatus Microthrix sp.]MBK9298019.1 class I SAM-dependent methyltransferase [Candidatus Microthrix subdominans]MBK6309966.1 class I SAM-dependent methyltransferase [Candidatus Microthrix sp.]MBK6439157.1 class I SAM-dependent methyltransferase [Candidatus Microthrix sp.]MBK6967860.1 class I SAM-dependent methyltransferase [Candidatus Microthrix sp.]MBK7164522.1 class I SAM-dependent methyltransferase [Candidatus Microthrix sp.]
MSFYTDRILPPIIDRVLSTGHVKKHRSHVIPGAVGTVVELGFGTGTNLEFYDVDAVDEVLAIDPASGARNRAAARISNWPKPVRWVALDGEHLPMEDASVDTVVAAFTLCTIPDVASALAEARRVLKPNGQLRYLEHGLHDDSRVAARQRLIEPVWKVFSGGCHLTRDPDELVREAGFELIESTRHTMPGPPITNALYEGVAVPAGHS